MKFHPVISIILGIITTFVFISVISFMFIYPVSNGGSVSSWFIIFIIFGLLLGGFIATNFAKEMKIRYSLYEGLVLGVLVYINEVINQVYNIEFLIFVIILSALISGIGGYLAKSWGKPIQKTRSIFKRFKKEKV
jgi:hypothetical protein